MTQSSKDICIMRMSWISSLSCSCCCSHCCCCCVLFCAPHKQNVLLCFLSIRLHSNYTDNVVSTRHISMNVGYVQKYAFLLNLLIAVYVVSIAKVNKTYYAQHWNSWFYCIYLYNQWTVVWLQNMLKIIYHLTCKSISSYSASKILKCSVVILKTYVHVFYLSNICPQKTIETILKKN